MTVFIAVGAGLFLVVIILFITRRGVSVSSGSDPVAEAEVYRRYGMKENAVAVLSEALRKDPDNVALRKKLAELEE